LICTKKKIEKFISDLGMCILHVNVNNNGHFTNDEIPQVVEISFSLVRDGKKVDKIWCTLNHEKKYQSCINF